MAHTVRAEINCFNDTLSFKCMGYKLCETHINYFYHLHHFHRGFIYDALSISVYMALKSRMDEWWIWNCVERIFFHWHYSPLWALVCRTMSFHFFLSATNCLHLLTPSTWRSLSASSFHLFLSLPLLLVPSSSWVKTFLGILSSSILSRWPNQLILCPFIHFTIFVEGLSCCRIWGSVWAFSLGSDEIHEKNSVDVPTDKRIRCLPNTVLQPTLLGYYCCCYYCILSVLFNDARLY